MNSVIINILARVFWGIYFSISIAFTRSSRIAGSRIRMCLAVVDSAEHFSSFQGYQQPRGVPAVLHFPQHLILLYF